jgi:hypothetical protein
MASSSSACFRYGLTAFGVFAATMCCIVSPAAVASPVDSSNSLAMVVANKRPAARFRGTTVISPPGLWLTYAAVYISTRMSAPSLYPWERSKARDDLLDLANMMGYADKPPHDRVLADAAELKTSASGGDIAMRLWTVGNAGLGGPTRSELVRLGVSAISHAMDRTSRSQMNTWLSQHSGGAFRANGTEVPAFGTGVLFTTVEHRLAFPSSFREDSVVAPSIIPTATGGVASLPGKSIAHFTDASSITGIRLDATAGRFFLFTGTSDDLQRMLDGLSISKWAEMKSRFKAKPGRIVDTFLSQSAYDFLSLVRLGNSDLWGGGFVSAVQRGSINFDSDKIDLIAATEVAAGGCCADYVVNPQTESQFQWSSVTPLVFIDEAPSGLIMFLGYRL